MSVEIMLTETRIRIGDLAEREGVALSTVWRWIKRYSVRYSIGLETFTIGGNTWTTEEAFNRFVINNNKELKE